jgi:hypothetical protein
VIPKAGTLNSGKDVEIAIAVVLDLTAWMGFGLFAETDGEASSTDSEVKKRSEI